jgi:hypothetical protein
MQKKNGTVREGSTYDERQIIGGKGTFSARNSHLHNCLQYVCRHIKQLRKRRRAIFSKEVVYLEMDLEVGQMNFRMHITIGKRHVRFPTILSIPEVGKQVIPSLTALRRQVSNWLSVAI